MFDRRLWMVTLLLVQHGLPMLGKAESSNELNAMTRTRRYVQQVRF